MSRVLLPLACPPWCTSDHTRDNLDEGTVEHWSPIWSLQAGAGDTSVAVYVADDLDTRTRGEAAIYIGGDNALPPAGALQFAAAVMNAVDIAHGITDRGPR